MRSGRRLRPSTLSGVFGAIVLIVVVALGYWYANRNRTTTGAVTQAVSKPTEMERMSVAKGEARMPAKPLAGANVEKKQSPR